MNHAMHDSRRLVLLPKGYMTQTDHHGGLMHFTIVVALSAEQELITMVAILKILVNNDLSLHDGTIRHLMQSS